MKEIVIILIMATINFASTCWGFTITQPKQGTVFHPGDTVTVKTEIASGEQIKAVVFAVSEIGKGIGDLWPPYEYVFTIDPEFVGTAEILAIAKLENGTGIQAKIQITVVLPSNIRLTGIEVDPNPVFLYKMLPNSDPNDVRIFETKQLGVGGMYSDGIERGLTSSASGTTYTSSDESIVKVDKEGKMTAQGIGKAKITVMNGKFSKTVDVIVKPYK
ncbi:MAG: Ig-like domain-containing protein [Nitrospirae bacterium]|nr:Ig-like domain-containing protein [Nitrospirota bacterium]